MSMAVFQLYLQKQVVHPPIVPTPAIELWFVTALGSQTHSSDMSSGVGQTTFITIPLLACFHIQGGTRIERIEMRQQLFCSC